MIPGLYAENEINFAHNGLGLLVDTIYCYPEEVRNGSYELELVYPVFSVMYKEIKANRWIKAKANDRFEPQLFRIYFISKPIGGKITIKAEHISYLLKDNFIETLNYTGDCNGALNALNNSAAFFTGFTFTSNVTDSKNFDFDLRNFWECVIGKDDSIISQFGTGIDIVRNNKNISLLSNGGQDNNVLIAYRKNLTGFTLEEDWTGRITKIYPYATQNDVRITLPEKYVDSKYISKNPNPRIAPVDFTNEFAEGETITADAVRQKAIQYFIDTQCDIPKLNYNIEFIALSKTEEYKNFAMNESIALLDYVIVRHELYGVDTKIKVVKAKYDSLGEKYLKLELGIVKNTITNLIKNTNKKIEETNKKVDDTKAELKEDIKEANKATSDLEVKMEKSDSDILLEVKNNKTDTDTVIQVMDGKIEERVTTKEFKSFKEQTADEISQRVEYDKFGSQIIQHFNEIIQSIVDATGTHTCTFNWKGLNIQNGGLIIYDSDGNIIMQFNDGTAVVEDIEIKNTARGSWFYTALLNMLRIDLMGDLYVSEEGLYINGTRIKTYVKNLIDTYKK